MVANGIVSTVFTWWMIILTCDPSVHVFPLNEQLPMHIFLRF